MTATNGWPGEHGVPMNPQRDGWHWVRRIDEKQAHIQRWIGGQFWLSPSFGGPKTDMANYEYLGPVLTPEEPTALQARVAELEAETKKAKWIHQYEVKEFQSRATKLTRLVEILVENDPNDMAADAVTVFEVWQKEARELLARHARLDARQAGMEKMRENESAEIRAALKGKKDE